MRAMPVSWRRVRRRAGSGGYGIAVPSAAFPALLPRHAVSGHLGVALWRVPRSICMPPHAFCAICAVGYRCGNRCLWWCAAVRPGVAVMAFPAVRSERGAIHAVASRAFVDKGR